MAFQTEKISSLVKEQLPEFIQADYQTFVAFIEAYFEFLEQDQGAQDTLRNAQKYEDIDSTIEAFVGEFKKEFAKDIPEYIIADKKNLYKNIKDFYQSKGSEKSYQLLFRILYNENVTFFYPSSVILRPSDGKWTSDNTLRVTKITGDVFSLIGTKITGGTSGASATIENIVSFQEGTQAVYELFLNTDSIVGSFQSNEVITSTVNFTTISVRVNYSFIGANITNPGTGYSIGDILTVTGGSGLNAALKVSHIYDDGGIKRVQVTNFGSQYNTAPTISAASTGDGNATLTAIVGALCTYEGYYVGVDGQLSEAIKLQDSKYYQAFSYVIRVGQSINLWRDAVKTILHPAGLEFFGEVNISSIANVKSSAKYTFIDTPVSVRMSNASLAIRSTKQDYTLFEYIVMVLGQYLPTAPLSQSATEFSYQASAPYGFGTNYGTLDLFKFRFPLYEAGTQKVFGATDAWNQPYAGTINAGYWNTYANTQLKDIGNLIIGDIVNSPNKKLNICPEPYVLITP